MDTMATRISRWFLKWAHNKDSMKTNHAADDASLEFSEQSVRSDEMDNDSKIQELRQAAIKCKSSFVTLKLSLMYIVCDERTDTLPLDRKCIEEALDAMLAAQETSVNILTELSQVYKEKGSVEMMQTVSDDMELIYSESSEAQHAAFRCVCSSSKLSNSDEQKEKTHDLVQKIEMLQGELDRLREKCEGYENEVNQSAKKKNESQAKSPVHINSAETYDEPEAQQIGNDLWNQLERVSIPVFTGDKMTYEGWRTAFQACVDEAPVSTVYKLLQLKKYLSGEPLQLIERLGHSAEAYEVAKSKLDRKYGGKRRQTARYLQQLQQFKELKDGDPKTFEAYADLLEMAVFTLKGADRLEELKDGTLYSTLLNKLSDRMMVEYLRWIADKDAAESVESLTKWALRESEFRVISAETKEGLNGSSPQNAFFAKEKTERVEPQVQKDYASCSVCDENPALVTVLPS